MNVQQCPFCRVSAERIVGESPLALAIRDAFPISPGHTLIVPRRHIGSFFEASSDERTEMLALIDAAKRRIDMELSPAGYNIGINDGEAAGQTVLHLHVHLIPRFRGDVEDPRGGVRWIISDKADYWSQLSSGVRRPE
jgi:diadenosine tetraphosphate (Ap4A) HIT family hydrolase